MATFEIKQDSVIFREGNYFRINRKKFKKVLKNSLNSDDLEIIYSEDESDTFYEFMTITIKRPSFLRVHDVLGVAQAYLSGFEDGKDYISNYDIETSAY